MNQDGWVWHYLKGWKIPNYYGSYAAERRRLSNVRSFGIVDEKWQLESTGASPTITTPEDMAIEAPHAPYLQLRWTRTGEPPCHARPYVEWMREGDTGYGEDRRVYFGPGEEVDADSGAMHSLIEMYPHPKWSGKIKNIRISLAPGESDVKFAIDSFFTVYDTRHSINNPIFNVSPRMISLELKNKPVRPIHIVLDGKWSLVGTPDVGSRFEITDGGAYRFDLQSKTGDEG